MNIDKFRDFVLFLARKAQSGSNPTPAQFNIAVERAFIGWVMQHYGNPHEYQPGQPIPRMAWQQTQKISDDLRFLLTKKTFFINIDGQLVVPDGTTKDINTQVAPKYLHASSLRFNHIITKNGSFVSKEVEIDVLRDSEIGGVLSSSINNPTTRYPVCAFYDTYIQFYPKTMQKVIFTYLRVPTVPFWAHTLDSNNRPVYDASKSVDIESPDDSQNDIALRTLEFLGISIREPMLIQYANQMAKEK